VPFFKRLPERRRALLVEARLASVRNGRKVESILEGFNDELVNEIAKKVEKRTLLTVPLHPGNLGRGPHVVDSRVSRVHCTLSVAINFGPFQIERQFVLGDWRRRAYLEVWDKRAEPFPEEMEHVRVLVILPRFKVFANAAADENSLTCGDIEKCQWSDSYSCLPKF
jgi:hypothetical protein